MFAPVDKSIKSITYVIVSGGLGKDFSDIATEYERSLLLHLLFDEFLPSGLHAVAGCHGQDQQRGVG
jgi:hypothetical protein